jgi:hypothetical protein
MSVVTSNANMSSGAMVTEVIAVTTVIRTGVTAATMDVTRAEVIDPGRGPRATAVAMATEVAMVTAVLGAAGQRRMATVTNGPDMRSRRGRQRRFGAGAATKPVLTATRIETPADHDHPIQYCRHLLLLE